MTFWSIISEVTRPATSFVQSNPLAAIAVMVVLIFLIYRKPFFFFTVFLVGLLVVGALYLIMSASNSGLSVKERMIRPQAAPQTRTMQE
jgi:hypothetical protein